MGKKSSFYLITGICVFFVIEFLLFAYFSVFNGEFSSTKNLRGKSLNYWDKQIEDCDFDNRISPHPYLGYVYKPSPDCFFEVNSYGFQGKEFPKQKTKNFNILMIGGSVADILASIKKDGELVFENYLNKSFKVEGFERIKVFNGAVGAYAQPQQMIVNELYGDVFDGVISIEGFNEHFHYGHTLIGKPADSYYSANPHSTMNGQMNIANQIYLGKLRSLIRNLPIINFSYLFYLIEKTFEWILLDQKPMKLMIIENGFNSYRPDAFERNLMRHMSNILSIKRTADFRNQKHLILLQPIPLIMKELTKEEERVMLKDNYASLYKKMESRLAELSKKEGVQFSSLMNLLEGKSGSYYVDHIHFNFSYPVKEGYEDGQQVLIERVSSEIALAWGFKRVE